MNMLAKCCANSSSTPIKKTTHTRQQQTINTASFSTLMLLTSIFECLVDGGITENRGIVVLLCGEVAFNGIISRRGDDKWCL